jgi:hypothetical protein
MCCERHVLSLVVVYDLNIVGIALLEGENIRQRALTVIAHLTERQDLAAASARLRAA